MYEDSYYIREYINNKSEAAASAIVHKYQRFVYLTVLRILENSEESKDVSQEVFIKAFESLNRFRGDSSLKTWLYRISVNMATNVLRKRKLRTFFSLSNNEENFSEIPTEEQNPEEDFTNKELESEFLKSLSKLPKKQRETFALRYFENMPYNEISELLRVSVGGLKANYFHAVRKIAEDLKTYINPDSSDNFKDKRF